MEKLTIGCGLIGQSGDTPVSPVNFSRRALSFPESGLFVGHASLATKHCPVHRGLVQV
jgi:hypothetical protein